MQNVKEAKVRDKNSNQERGGDYFAWGKAGGRDGKSTKFYWTSSIRDSSNLLTYFEQALKSVARQDTDCADGNKDIRIEATLLIPRQEAQPNQAFKFCRKTTLIRLCDTYKQYGSSPIDRMSRRGQIVCLGSDLNQNSNLHRMSQHRASWTELEMALSELNARRSDR